MNSNETSCLQKIMEISISDPDKYSDTNTLLHEIRQKISPNYKEAKTLSLRNPGKNEVKNGDLVRFRGAIQNDHQYHIYEPIVEVKLVDGRQVRMSPTFVDPEKIAEKSPPFATPNAACKLYTVMAIPGESKWATLDADRPSADELTGKMGQMNMVDKVRDNSLLLLKIYDQGIPDFFINDIIDLYGIYYDHFEGGGPVNADPNKENDFDMELECSSGFYRLPHVYVIEHRILRRQDLIRPPQIFIDSKQLHEILLKLAYSVTGCDTTTRDSAFTSGYFLSAMVAKTYEWKEEHPVPLCSVPVAFLNVTNPREFIECAKMLLPMVQVIPMTAQILEQERLFSRMDHETGLMQSGRLQLVRGTLLILDFTQYKTAAKATKENYVLENIEAIQRLIDEQKLNIDYGPHVPKFPLAMDISVMALCPAFHTHFFKFPTLVPLAKGKPTDGTSPIEAFKNEMTPGLIQNFRYHLSNAYEQLDKIKLDREQQKLIVETFTGIRERLSTEAPYHFRHLLALTRVHTALGGKNEMEYALYQHLLGTEYERLALLR